MSDPILPLAVWAEGTLQNDIPANDNALRMEAQSRPWLGVADDEAGGDAEGDVWIVGDTPTGAFATFDEDDIAIFDGAGWHAWAPFAGMRGVVAGARVVFNGSAWIADPSIGGSAVDSVNGKTGAVVLELGDLDDVDTSGASDGDALGWDNTAGKWVPQAPASGAAWGAISGTLSSQTDLQAALDGKASAGVNVQSTTSTSTLTPTYSNDLAEVTAQAAALTIANPSGTAVDGHGIVIRIKDDGTTRALTWDSEYRAIGLTLPTATTAGKQHYVACIRNSAASKMDVLAVGVEA